MTPLPRIFESWRLLALLSLVLSAGLFATTLSGYQVSRNAIHDAIVGQELPLTSSNIYSEIQKDLVRPILISSTMASDTFLRDWVLKGERNVEDMARYLREVKTRYGAFSSFFVSDKTGLYYTGEGVLKRVNASEPRDAWYYRVRAMKEDYEINVDPDLANADALTIFINYRVYDFQGRYIGATGVGLTVDAVRRLIRDYQQRFQRTIYFVNEQGRLVVFANGAGRLGETLHAMEGIGPRADHILRNRRGAYQFDREGQSHLLNVTYVPELKWFLFVEKNEEEALYGIRRTLYLNLAVSLALTIIVVLLTHIALRRYQERMEDMAARDKLTGLLNRQAFTLLIDKVMAENRREPRPMAFLLADVDHFKAVNDHHGHLAGDRALAMIAQLLREGLRASDIAVRWGGEEFLLVLRGCDLVEARRIAEALRQKVESARIDFEGTPLPVTLSIGIAAHDSGEPAEQAIRRADAALYEAKHGGRNRVAG